VDCDEPSVALTLGEAAGLDEPDGTALGDVDGEPEPVGVGVGVAAFPDVLGDGDGLGFGVRLLVGTGTGTTGWVECECVADFDDPALVTDELSGLTTT
jgi:hypothetical protein